MGADLYIRALTEPRKAKYENLFRAACERRDAWNKDIEAYQTIANIERSGLPGSTLKIISGAKASLATCRKMKQKEQEEVVKFFDLAFGGPGYFRDSYNGSSVFWRLGLSWWKDVSGGKMTTEQLKDVLAKVRSQKLRPCTMRELEERGCRVDNGKNSLKNWQKMWRNKKRNLIRFLQRAIRYNLQGSEVYFSL